jgi:two-component system response regulator AlgR
MASNWPAISVAFPAPPAVIFTTAYDNYAVQAFDLNAVDYLLKPVRAQRLLTALQKVHAARPADRQLLASVGREMRGGGRTHLSCHERGRLLLVPVGEVLYFKADLKYVTARTVDREYLLDEALTHLEERVRRALHPPAPRRAGRQVGARRLREGRR